MGNIAPSFKTLTKIIDFFQVSFDYCILGNNCLYPRNLKFLKLAKTLDDFKYSQARSHIETTARSSLDSKNIENIQIKQDFIDMQLTKTFHSNLKKEIRKFNKLTQTELANKINVSQALLGMYEFKNLPPIGGKIIKLSEILNISIHAISTGEKLFF